MRKPTKCKLIIIYSNDVQRGTTTIIDNDAHLIRVHIVSSIIEFSGRDRAIIDRHQFQFPRPIVRIVNSRILVSYAGAEMKISEIR